MKILENFIRALLSPAYVLHELTHAAAAGMTASRRIHLGLNPRVELSWIGNPSRWRVIWTHLAPTVLGLSVGFPAYTYWTVNVLPSLDFHPLTKAGLLLAAALYLLIYTWPSLEDLGPLLRYLHSARSGPKVA